jgi:hypothetical protein
MDAMVLLRIKNDPKNIEIIVSQKKSALTFE